MPPFELPFLKMKTRFPLIYSCIPCRSLNGCGFFLHLFFFFGRNVHCLSGCMTPVLGGVGRGVKDALTVLLFGNGVLEKFSKGLKKLIAKM